jgi:hypothetical protein
MKSKQIAGLIIKGLIVITGALIGSALFTPVADETTRVLFKEDDDEEEII